VRGRDKEAREKERRLFELEARVRQAEASIQIREAAVWHKEDLTNIREMDITRREADVHNWEEQVRLKEADVLQREEEVARREGDVRKKEGQVKAFEVEAQNKHAEARRKEVEVRRLEEKARQSVEEAERREASARRAEASARMRGEPQHNLPETSHQHDKQRRAPQHEAEPRTNTEIQTVEEQLREKERYLQIREAEVQKMLRSMDERREAMTLQADGLQKSTTMKEWEENLRLREAALTQQMANERQRDRRGNGAASASGRESDSFSSPSGSTIGNFSRRANLDHFSKSIVTKLKYSGSYSNEG